jgi:hypothetical protein
MIQQFLLDLNILLKSARHDRTIINKFKYCIKTQ